METYIKWKMLTSFIRSEVTLNTSQFFSTLDICCNAKSLSTPFFSRGLKPDKPEGCFEREILENFHTFQINIV